MKNLFNKLLIICILCVLATTLGVSFAWFKENNSNIDASISNASVIREYFHCGTGSQEDPFVITRPIHYYHLVELYQRINGFDAQDYHFQLGYDKFPGHESEYVVFDYDDDGSQKYDYDDDGNKVERYTTTLNMKYYSGDLSLIPVGTSTHPFGGTFDGKQLKISDLSIISWEQIGSSYYGSCDIGVFGYVKGTATIKDLYIDNLILNIDGADATKYTGSDTSSIHDQNSDNTKDTVCIGYAIGHLLQYTNASTIDYRYGTVGVNASPLTNVYINNATVIGGSGSGSSSTALSYYGFIGYVDRLDNKNSVTIQTYVENIESANNGEEGWGGSIDMTNLYDRITDQIGIAENNSTYGRKYPTSETIIASSKSNGYPTTIVNSMSSTNMANSINYWSAMSTVALGTSVNSTGGSIYGTWSGDWTYLYGLPSSKTTSTTTWTKTGEIVDAYLISSNGCYLTYDEAIVNGVTASKYASKWIPVNKTVNEEIVSAKYYMLIDNTEYYLAVDSINATTGLGTIKVVTSSSAASTFIKNASNEFYTVYSGNNYYLSYDGTWGLSKSRTRYALSDGKGHYLSATTDGIRNESTLNTGAMWEVSSLTGNTSFYFTSGGTRYYLTYDSELTIKSGLSSAPIWKREVGANGAINYYYEVNNFKYYLLYDQGWKAVITSGIKLGSNNHFIKLSLDGSDVIISDTSEDDATIFQISNVGGGSTLVANINGIGYYLGSNGTTLTASNTIQTVWSKDTVNVANENEQTRYYLTLDLSGTIADGAYYLMFKDEWCLGKISGYEITDNVHYLSIDKDELLDDTSQKITNKNSAYSTIWQITDNKVFTVIGTDIYYLTYNSKGLTISPTEKTWTISNNNIYSTYDGDNLYICYDEEWLLKPETSYYITDTTSSHYLTYRNTAIVDGAEADACTWVFNDKGEYFYIYTYIGTERNYLSINDTVLARSSEATNWYQTTDTSGKTVWYIKDSANISYYLTFDSLDNTWKLMVIEETVRIRYQEVVNDQTINHYLNTTGVSLGDTTNESSSLWVFVGNQIYTYINTKKYYLTYKVDTILKKSIKNETITITGASLKVVPTISTTNNTKGVWSIDSDNHYYLSIGLAKYYLVYDTKNSEWTFFEDGLKRIYGSDGKSLVLTKDVTIDNTNQTVTFSTDPTYKFISSTSSDYIWHIEKYSSSTNYPYLIYTMIGDTAYYVMHNDTRARATPLYYQTTLPSDSANLFKYSSSSSELMYSTYATTFRIGNINDAPYMVQSTEFHSVYANGYYLYINGNKTNILSATPNSSYLYEHRYFKIKTNSDDSNKIAIYASISSKTRYLTTNSNGVVSYTTTETYWTKDGNKLYIEFDGIKFYLNCTNGTWSAQPDIYYYFLSGSSYLTISGTTGITGSSTLSRWFSSSSPSASTKKFYTMVGTTAYYLCFSASSGVSFTTDSSSATTFTTSSGQVSITDSGKTFYLVYDESGWNFIPDSGSTISNSSKYLNASSATTVTAGSSSTTKWYFSDTTNNAGQIYTYYAGKKLYLNVNSSNNPILSTTALTWSKDGSKYYYTSGSTKHYLCVSGSDWITKTADKYYITSTSSNGTTYYMIINSGKTGTTGTSSAGSTDYYKFVFDESTHYLYAVIDSKNIYVTKYSPSNGNNLDAQNYSSSSLRQFYYDSSTKSLTMVVNGTTWYIGLRVTGTSSFQGWKVYNSKSGVDSSTNFNINFVPIITGADCSVSTNSSTKTKNITNSTGATPQDVTIECNPSHTEYKKSKNYSNSAMNKPTKITIEAQVPNIGRISHTLTDKASVSNYSVTSTLKSVGYSVTPSNISIIQNIANPVIGFTLVYDQLYESTVANPAYHRGTYLPLRLDTTDENNSTSYYSDYRASTKNTGYIIGGTNSAASGSGRGDIRVSRYGISNIRNSYNSSSKQLTNIYTFNDSGTTPVLINPNANSYTEFAGTSQIFSSILAKDSSEVYGLHFMDATISMSRLMYAESTMIMNKSYVNYEFPESCIDFNAGGQGHIVLYAGDYYTSGNSCFFSLNQIFRDENQHITNILEIIEVYTKPGITEREYYIYKYKDSNGNYTYSNQDGSYTGSTTLPSGYNTTPIFKTSWLTNPTNGRDFDNQYIYYFEIPCNKGEYALGSVDGKDGGYLLYLDVAANGVHGNTYNQVANISSNPLFTQFGYISEGTLINSLLNIGYTAPINNGNDKFSITVSYDPTKEENRVYDERYGTNCTIFNIYIVNRTGLPFDISILLVDDDDDPDNDYNYRYRVYYNGELYTMSNAYDPSIGCFYASSSLNLSSN